MNLRVVSLAAVVALLLGCSDGNRLRAPLAPALSGGSQFGLVSTIAMSSNIHEPNNNSLATGEIYLLNPDGTNPRRLTFNTYRDFFPNLSPDGKKIVFDSNRLRTPEEPQSTSDLFVMNTDGSEQTPVIRGSSATWSPNGKNIAFHASASGVGLPINNNAGAATWDSDIFTVNLDDVLAGVELRRNLTNSPDAIDDDADWSPDGTKLAFTSHLVTDNQVNSVTAEIYTINPNGTGPPVRLTHNTEEERAAAWSPDGSRICYMARHDGFDFEICVMNADGSGQTQLTFNDETDATPTWSPDGTKILFQRVMPGPTVELWTMNPDGSEQMQLTFAPGSRLLAHWGQLRVHDGTQSLRASR